MLELYHHGSSVCAAKSRFAIMEKGVEWTGHYLDILAGDQFDPEYLKLNPKGLVPTLVHDGKVITESSVICEYIDDAFPEPSLKPDDPFERSEMRQWTKIVDEYVHPTCGELTFVSCHRHIILRLGPQGVEEFLNGTPGVSVTPEWRKRKRELVELGLKAPAIEEKIRLHFKYMEEANKALEGKEWLTGDMFSLADVAMAPYLNRLDMLGMSALWTDRLPNLERWFQTIKSRPLFVACFLDQCPPELTRDLMEFGSKTWPDIVEMLDLSVGK